MTAIDPANLEPGQHPPVPATSEDLLIEALRFTNRVSGLLNSLDAAVLRRIESDDDHRFDDLHDLLLRRFSDCSGVHLFIAAHNLRIELPLDLCAETDEEDDDDDEWVVP